jgi:hypothetical protein
MLANKEKLEEKPESDAVKKSIGKVKAELGELEEAEQKEYGQLMANIKKLEGIKKEKLDLSKALNLMERFRIQTPIFNSVVPETQYGRSAKDFIEEAPISAGIYLAMVDGYFVMLRFSPGTYWIHSWASAPREAHGPYFSELLYQVKVHERVVPRGKVTRWRPSRNERLLRQILSRKEKNGEFTNAQRNRLLEYLQPETIS